MENILLFVDIAAAFTVAVLCGMGVGGGGLLVIYLTLCRGVPQLEAQGINLAFFVFSALASLSVHIKKGRVPLARTLILGISGALGSLGGVAAAHVLDPSTVRLCFGFMLVIASSIILLPRKKGNKNSPAP